MCVERLSVSGEARGGVGRRGGDRESPGHRGGRDTPGDVAERFQRLRTTRTKILRIIFPLRVFGRSFTSTYEGKGVSSAVRKPPFGPKASVPPQTSHRASHRLV